LQILDHLFSKENYIDSKEFFLYFEKLDGVDLLEELLDHGNHDIYKLVGKILYTYGDVEMIDRTDENKVFKDASNLAFMI
jgi:hypothetical protein